MNKQRKQLKNFGMLKEFDIWKETVSLEPKKKFSVGSKVRFIKNWLPYNVHVGAEGKVVRTEKRFDKRLIQIKVNNQDIPFWKRELNIYLEEI